MNDHTLRVLEFDKITGAVSGYASTEAGRLAILALVPSPDAVVVLRRLRETGEFTGILQAGESPPLDGIVYIKEVVAKLEVTGGILTPAELLNTVSTLCAGRRVKQFFQRVEEKTGNRGLAAPLLCARASKIRLLRHIEEAVSSAIDDRAEVRDAASPALRRVRKQIMRVREEILGRMNRILQDGGFQKVIQEPVITVRDDRYVLPLKPNFRQSLQGIVHGQSGSRSTLFVEPLELLEHNNRLAELRMEEREEVERILRGLTSLMAKDAEAIRSTVEILAALDAVHAAARFGIEHSGTVPVVSVDGTLRLRAARHPLLVIKFRQADDRKNVTANDIELRGDERVLIVSGPNAGGKTVILKTVGLLALMAQCGIPVTVGEGSEFPLFSSVFADIGDEQSLDHDLSTFSSHISQIAAILREADGNSLVLLDELGSGTDPNEGAGLGAAVLESLIARGVLTLVTTHHSVLKLFASQKNGAVNAAMEFDPLTLRPTYRLIPGRPGRSYGLDMAVRLGIPDEVIARARLRISDDDIRLETLLRQVESDAARLAAEREQLARKQEQLEHERAEAESLIRSAKEDSRAMRIKTSEEAKGLLASLRKKLQELTRMAVHEPAMVKNSAREVEALALQLQPVESTDQPVFAGPGATLRRGDRVRLPRVNKTGLVLGARRDKLEIEVDGKKFTFSSSEVTPLEPVSEKRYGEHASGWSFERHDDEGPSDRVNLLGLRVEEALAEVDRGLDRAGVGGLSVVTIIHGLGTGALKTAVTDFLKNHPLVAAMRPGASAEGGAGVTVVELRK